VSGIYPPRGVFFHVVVGPFPRAKSQIGQPEYCAAGQLFGKWMKNIAGSQPGLDMRYRQASQFADNRPEKRRKSVAMDQYDDIHART
jgi:hypothetical protein